MPSDRAKFGPFGLTPDVFRTELEKVTSWSLNVTDAVGRPYEHPDFVRYTSWRRWDSHRMAAVAHNPPKRNREPRHRPGRQTCFHQRSHHSPFRFYIPESVPSDLPYLRLDDELLYFRNLVDPHVPDDAEYGHVVQTPDAAKPSVGALPGSSGQGAPDSASLSLPVPSAGPSQPFAAPNIPMGRGEPLISSSIAGALMRMQQSFVSTLNRPGPQSIQEALALIEALIPRDARHVAALNSITAFRSQFQADLYHVVTDQVGALTGHLDAAPITGDPLLGTLVGSLILNSGAYPVGNVLQPPLGPTGTAGAGSAPSPRPGAPPTPSLSTPMASSASMVPTPAVGAGAGPVPAWAPGVPSTPSGPPSGPGPSGGAGGSAASFGP
ncbi:hypothetical protein FGB62_260g06 [Gracilaria domingensis]|nr:hypothetical protein FGB62_260g06 [Gracilaria domingensis]